MFIVSFLTILHPVRVLYLYTQSVVLSPRFIPQSVFYTQSAVCSPLSIFYIGILNRQKKSRPTKTFSTGKIFLVRQKDFLTDKNISCPRKLISHPINVFLDRQKCSQVAKNFVHHGFPYCTRNLHIVFFFNSFFSLFFFLGGGVGGSRRGSRLGVHNFVPSHPTHYLPPTPRNYPQPTTCLCMDRTPWHDKSKTQTEN